MKLIGVDVGGTFTDMVLTDTDTHETRIHKVPSTPEDPSIGVLKGVTEICDLADVPEGKIEHVYHGTTVATNAALTYSGARTGMITTKGFRDIIHIGRHQRPQHYSIMQEIPWHDRPLVQRRYRKTITERLIPPRGEVLIPLDEEEVREAARELRDQGVESITVCFLFSYLNPEHEQRAKEIIQEECPKVYVSTSSEVSPQFREFERFTTASMNAFIGPLVRDYVNQLDNSLDEAGLHGDLHIMCSNGGVAPANAASDQPVLTLMSGLAAGVLGGAWVGELSGRDKLITFDVGGTSADIGVITEGKFAEATARDTFVAGYPIMVPMIDLHTIGAGGGSIAYLDEGGAFKVGPRSAGAVPGPAAYGRGGTEPTVTDANVVLGRLDKDNFLGGEMALDADAAQKAVGDLAKSLDMSLEETAEGIITVLNSNMANAIRSRTVQKGIDPREYVLVASGGAGPLHGAEVARMLAVPEIIIPPFPGINSAMGLLTTDLKYDRIHTEFMMSSDLDYERINADFAEMERQLQEQLIEDGIDVERAQLRRYADARYVGQGYELRVSMPDGEVSDDNIAASLDEFHQVHQDEYGHAFPDQVVEIVNIRVTAIGPTPKISRPPKPRNGSLEEALIKTDKSIFRVDEQLETLETAFYRRDALPLNSAIEGPAVILQTDTTTVIPPHCTGFADETGNLIIKIGGAT